MKLDRTCYIVLDIPPGLHVHSISGPPARVDSDLLVSG